MAETRNSKNKSASNLGTVISKPYHEKTVLNICAKEKKSLTICTEGEELQRMSRQNLKIRTKEK